LQNAYNVRKGDNDMAKTKTFSLGDPYDEILADLVSRGRFGTETEIVRAGIRMLADYEVKIRALRREIDIADAEVEAGLGTEYASADDLLKDVINAS